MELFQVVQDVEELLDPFVHFHMPRSGMRIPFILPPVIVTPLPAFLPSCSMIILTMPPLPASFPPFHIFLIRNIRILPGPGSIHPVFPLLPDMGVRTAVDKLGIALDSCQGRAEPV